MDKLGKLSSTVSKKLAGKKSGPHNSSGGQGLQELVKDATAKSLRRPDPELNQQVVDLIGSAIHTEGPQEVSRILTERLALKNPHKVWLAIQLIREVLRRCETELSSVRDDIMFEVGKVASGAMNRFNSNLADQQRAKSAAFDLLKTYGQDGHILSQPHLEQEKKAAAESQAHSPRQHSNHRGDRANGRHPSSYPELSEAVETQIAMAISHNDLLQDMLLDTSSFESRTPEQRSLAGDVIMEATQFRQSFEALLAQLSAYDSTEANALMTTALEKMDILNNSLNLHKQNLKKQLQGQRPPHSQPGLGPGLRNAPSTQPSKPAAPRPPEANMAGLLELQQGFDAAHQPPQPATHDPFAASQQWNHPAPFQHPASGELSQRPQYLMQQPNSNPFSPAGEGGPSQYAGYLPHPGYGAQLHGQHGPQGFGQAPQSQGQGPQHWPGYPHMPGGQFPPYGFYSPGPYGYQYPPQQRPQSEAPSYGSHGAYASQQSALQPHHVDSQPPQGASPPPDAHPDGQQKATQLAPNTPPAATTVNLAANRHSPTPQRPVTTSGSSGSGFESSAFSAPATSAADAPDSRRSAVLAGYHSEGTSAEPTPPPNAASPADDWDLFFTERNDKAAPSAAATAISVGTAPEPAVGGGGIGGMTDAFEELATSRRGAAQ